MRAPVPGVPGCPTRRSVLAGLGLAAVSLPLVACGIRLEDDAPRVPLIPTREPVPGEAFLLSLLTDSLALAAEADAVGGKAASLPARLAPLHREQAAVLRSVLAGLGVPSSVVAAAERLATATTTAPPTPSATTAAPTPPASPTTRTTAPPTPASLAAHEAAALSPEAFTSLGLLDQETVDVVGSLLAQRAAAATLLGHVVGWPRGEWSDPGLAAVALESTRAAVYGFEVVAAQSRRAQATLAADGLATLRARATEQESLSGPDVAPPALGYPLPFQVATQAEAKQLAVHVLTGLRESSAAQLRLGDGAAQPLASLTRWLADTEVLASRWGVALAAFPGLQ